MSRRPPVQQTAPINAGSVDHFHGEIPRADVALALVAVLDTATTVGKAFNLVAGDEPVDRVIAAL